MKKGFSARDLALVAMGMALITVCSWLSVPAILPTGVPFTLQTFAVCLLAALYGLRLGMWTVGGYLLGFLLTALIVGLAVRALGRSFPVLLGSMVLGLAVCYAFGTFWFVQVYARSSGPIGVGTALAWCVLPYLLPDALKLTLAALLARRLYPILWKGRSA